MPVSVGDETRADPQGDFQRRERRRRTQNAFRIHRSSIFLNMPFFWRITFTRILAAELRERPARKPETFRSNLMLTKRPHKHIMLLQLSNLIFVHPGQEYQRRRTGYWTHSGNQLPRFRSNPFNDVFLEPRDDVR